MVFDDVDAYIPRFAKPRSFLSRLAEVVLAAIHLVEQFDFAGALVLLISATHTGVDVDAVADKLKAVAEEAKNMAGKLVILK